MNCLICKSKMNKMMFMNEWSKYDNKYYSLYKCVKCSFVRPNPLPYSEETKLKVYDSAKTIHFYNSKTKQIEYNSKEYKYYFKHFKPFVGFIEKYNLSGKALDIGCGTGHMLTILNKKGFQADGLDISPILVKALKPKFKVYCSDVRDFKPKVKYDLLILNQVIEHIEDPDDFVSSMSKLVKSGGYLILATPYLFGIVPSVLRTYWYGLGEGQHLNFFSPENIKTLLERNGFKMCEYQLLSVDYAHPSFPKAVNFISETIMRINITLGLGDNLFVVAKKN